MSTLTREATKKGVGTMELKEGTRIAVKVITKLGVKKKTGTYLECAGVQYCTIKDKQDKSYYLIHLDTGLNCASVEFGAMKEKDVFAFLKQKASEIDRDKLDEAVKKRVNELTKQGYEFPINE
jgi:hypothetical protein